MSHMKHCFPHLAEQLRLGPTKLTAKPLLVTLSPIPFQKSCLGGKKKKALYHEYLDENTIIL